MTEKPNTRRNRKRLVSVFAAAAAIAAGLLAGAADSQENNQAPSVADPKPFGSLTALAE